MTRPGREGVEDPRGRRYAYTLDMLVDLRRIALDLGILDGRPVNVGRTDFARRVSAAWGVAAEPSDEIIDYANETPEQAAERVEEQRIAREHLTGHVVDFWRFYRDRDLDHFGRRRRP